MSRFVNVSNVPIETLMREETSVAGRGRPYEIATCLHLKKEDKRTFCGCKTGSYHTYYTPEPQYIPNWAEWTDIEHLGEYEEIQHLCFCRDSICSRCLKSAIKKGIIEEVSEERYIRLLQNKVEELRKIMAQT